MLISYGCKPQQVRLLSLPPRKVRHKDLYGILVGMTFHHVNKRKQGDLGIAAAISWFTFNGYTVCLPFTEGQKFDLVVVKDNQPFMVQVKTTGFKENDNYVVQLRTNGGGNHKSPTKRLADFIDFLFILTEVGDKYLIPRSEVTVISALTLGSKWDSFKVV